MAYSKTYILDPTVGGDTVKEAIVTKLDGNADQIVADLNTHSGLTTGAHSLGSAALVSTGMFDAAGLAAAALSSSAALVTTHAALTTSAHSLPAASAAWVSTGAFQVVSQALLTTSSPTFVGETLTGLTASLPLFTGANKELVSKSVADAMAVLGLPGEIKMYGGSSAPTGWLFCNAAAINRTTYAALYAIIGTTFGIGDGSTTFNVPDMRGRVPIGVGTGTGGGSSGTGLPAGGSALTARALGAWKGTETHALEGAELASHLHTVNPPNTASGTESADHSHTGSGTSSEQSAYHTHTAGGGFWTDGGPTANIAIASPAANITVTANTGNESAYHTHTYSFTSSGKSATHTHSTDIAEFNSGSVGSGTAHETMQPTMCVNFMIKT